MSSLQLFALAALGCASMLIGLAVVAPSVWYRWTSRRGRVLGRWRVEIGLTGASILIGSAVALLAVFALE